MQKQINIINNRQSDHIKHNKDHLSTIRTQAHAAHGRIQASTMSISPHSLKNSINNTKSLLVEHHPNTDTRSTQKDHAYITTLSQKQHQQHENILSRAPEHGAKRHEEEERSQGHIIEMNSNATLKEGNEIIPVTGGEERTRTLGSHKQTRPEARSRKRDG